MSGSSHDLFRKPNPLRTFIQPYSEILKKLGVCMPSLQKMAY